MVSFKEPLLRSKTTWEASQFLRMVTDPIQPLTELYPAGQELTAPKALTA